MSENTKLFETPEISVVIPLYQKEHHIVTALESAFTACVQSGIPFEIVVVNDGSTDRSVINVIDWSQGSLDRQQCLHLIHQENAGASAARNTGWQEAKSDIIFFLDADDTWEKHHVSEIMDLMNTYPEGALYADAYNTISPEGVLHEVSFGIGTDKKGPLESYFIAMSSGSMVVSSTTAATRKKYLQQTGGFPEGINHGEDKVAWTKLALLGPVIWSPKVGATWNKSAENRSVLTQHMTKNSVWSDFLESIQDHPNLSDNERENVRIAINVDLARWRGEIQFYDHNTPDLYRNQACSKDQGFMPS